MATAPALTFLPKFAWQLEGFDRESDKRRTTRAENRRLMQEMAEQAAAAGKELSLTEWQNMIRETLGSDGFLYGYQPSRSALEAMRVASNNKAREVQERQAREALLFKVDTDKKMRDLVTDMVADGMSNEDIIADIAKNYDAAMAKRVANILPKARSDYEIGGFRQGKELGTGMYSLDDAERMARERNLPQAVREGLMAQVRENVRAIRNQATNKAGELASRLDAMGVTDEKQVMSLAMAQARALAAGLPNEQQLTYELANIIMDVLVGSGAMQRGSLAYQNEQKVALFDRTEFAKTRFAESQHNLRTAMTLETQDRMNLRDNEYRYQIHSEDLDFNRKTNSFNVGVRELEARTAAANAATKDILADVNSRKEAMAKAALEAAKAKKASQKEAADVAQLISSRMWADPATLIDAYQKGGMAALRKEAERQIPFSQDFDSHLSNQIAKIKFLNGIGVDPDGARAYHQYTQTDLPIMEREVAKIGGDVKVLLNTSDDKNPMRQRDIRRLTNDVVEGMIGEMLKTEAALYTSGVASIDSKTMAEQHRKFAERLARTFVSAAGLKDKEADEAVNSIVSEVMSRRGQAAGFDRAEPMGTSMHRYYRGESSVPLPARESMGGTSIVGGPSGVDWVAIYEQGRPVLGAQPGPSLPASVPAGDDGSRPWWAFGPQTTFPPQSYFDKREERTNQWRAERARQEIDRQIDLLEIQKMQRQRILDGFAVGVGVYAGDAGRARLQQEIAQIDQQLEQLRAQRY